MKEGAIKCNLKVVFVELVSTELDEGIQHLKIPRLSEKRKEGHTILIVGGLLSSLTRKYMDHYMELSWSQESIGSYNFYRGKENLRYCA